MAALKISAALFNKTPLQHDQSLLLLAGPVQSAPTAQPHSYCTHALLYWPPSMAAGMATYNCQMH